MRSHLMHLKTKSVLSTNTGETQIEIDLDQGFGTPVTRLVNAACALASRPDLAIKIQDILLAAYPHYKIIERKLEDETVQEPHH